MLQPFDHDAVVSFLHGDVDHHRIRGGAVPMLFAGWNPDDVPCLYFLNWATPGLNAACAMNDVKRLTHGVGVPRSARTRLKRDDIRLQQGGLRRLDDGILPDCTGERACRCAPCRS